MLTVPSGFGVAQVVSSPRAPRDPEPGGGTPPVVQESPLQTGGGATLQAPLQTVAQGDVVLEQVAEFCVIGVPLAVPGAMTNVSVPIAASAGIVAPETVWKVQVVPEAEAAVTPVNPAHVNDVTGG